MMEENQRKLDNLIAMLEELKKTLYRYWGLPYTPTPIPKAIPRSDDAGVVAPVESASSTVPADVSQPAAAEAAPPLNDPAGTSGADDAPAYAAAKARYDNEDYEGAIAAFTEFLSSFPASSHRDRAQFWIGKSLLNQSEYSRAIEAFETVRRDYPDSTYMAWTLHNQAVAHYKLGEREIAVTLMEEVVANYPTTTAAQDANRDLEQLRSGNP
jgi:tol-pal system protein YbgF